MKQLLLSACLLPAFLVATGHAGPIEEAVMAVMRLSEQPNYSWVATISDDARTYDIDGRTVREGYSHVRMPLINSVRRRLGRSAADTQAELVFHGNVACVIRTEDGWALPYELPRAEPLETDLLYMPGPSIGPMSGSGSQRGSLRGGGFPVGRAPDPREARRNYSNLQLAISLPHEELAVIVGSHEQFSIAGDTVSGTLTDLGAQLLLVRDGQKEITPLRAAGTFKLWLRDGMVSKYHLALEGVLRVEGERGNRAIEVHQSVDTVVKNVGSTEVAVPPSARLKLDRFASNAR